MPTPAQRRATLYRRRPDGSLEKKVVVGGTPGAFSGGWSLSRPGRTTAPAAPDLMAAESKALGGLITAATPKAATDQELSSRFSSLFDPTYAQNEKDINSELDVRSSRFGEDAAVSAARLQQQRAFAEGKMREQLAAGGAGGQLAGAQLKQTVDPYDQQAQDAATQSKRFTYDTAEERRKRILANQQAKAGARASYLANPNLRYEFSF